MKKDVQVPLILLIPMVAAVLSAAAACPRDDQQDASSLPTVASPAFATPFAIPTEYLTLPANASVFSGVANDAGQAVSFAREVAQACPPLCPDAVRIDSVAYVETDVAGSAALPPSSDGLWEPARNVRESGAPDDLPVWVIVMKGRFQEWYMGSEDHYGPVYTSLWVVVPKGWRGTFWYESNGEYDLSQLGEVIDVPLPLPRFPTPVLLPAG